MTDFQGIFRSEGTPEGRGQQQHLLPPVAAIRSHDACSIKSPLVESS